MKKIIAIVIFLNQISINIAFAQVAPFISGKNKKEFKSEAGLLNVAELQKYSSYSKTFLVNLKQNATVNDGKVEFIDTNFIKKYFLKKIGYDYFINAFLIIEDSSVLRYFQTYNIKISNYYGNVWVAQIPILNLEKIGAISKVLFINIEEPIHHELNNATTTTWTNWVHQGYQLPKKYFGNGVVVGIVDNGFDYTHPTFYDTTGTSYRVKRVWEQNATTGTPPNCVGCNYGRELATQTTILNAQRDNNTGSHGTHVTGIAAGGGAGTSGQFIGIAPMSDIVLVSQGDGDVEAVNAMQYIINYANSVNKPVIINNSWGKRIGARDGLSPLDQSINAMTDAGKLIIKSAGNNGGDLHHLSKTFSNTDTVLATFIRIDGDNKGVSERLLDIWGGTNSSFKVAAAIVNANNSYAIEDNTPFVGSWTNNIYNYALIDNDPVFSDYAYINYSTISSANFNSKPNIQVTIDNTDQDDSYRWIYIEIIAYNTTIHLWGDNGLDFVDLGLSGLGTGNDFYTITEPGNGTQIITIGAYNTTENTIGDIAPFSSKGPTSDGRLKPDITAPGNRIVSSVNSFDANYLSGGSEWGDVVTGVTNGTSTWYFAEMQGTSMAAPVATGILALWLEAYPNLTPTQTKSLLKDNAWTDAYTGTIPANGSTIWGWGKIDAHEGMKNLLQSIPSKPLITGNSTLCSGQTITLSTPTGFSGYEWTTGATTRTINVTSIGSYSVRVINSQGYISPWSDPKQVTAISGPNAPTFTPQSGCNPVTVTANSANCNGCTYSWNSGSQGPVAVFTSNTNYTVTVTNSNGCTATGNGTVTITNVPTVSILTTGVTICSGSSVTLSTSPTGSAYSWLGPSGFASNFPTATITDGGVYNVTVTNPGSCSGTAMASINISEYNAPVANAGNDVTILQGNSTTLTATGGVSYQWSNGASSQSTTVSPNNTATYTVTVTDVNGCTATDDVTVFVQSGSCNNVYTLSSTSVSVADAGGGCSVALTTDGGCSWSVNAGGCIDWVVANNPVGVGAATVSFTVEPNPLPSQRTCFVTIGGELFTIIQDSAPSTGVEEIAGIQNVAVYPNPNRGVFRITATLHDNIATQLKLYNTLGQVVYEITIQPNGKIIDEEINLNNAATGIYQLQLIAGDKRAYEKLFVEN